MKEPIDSYKESILGPGREYKVFADQLEIRDGKEKFSIPLLDISPEIKMENRWFQYYLAFIPSLICIIVWFVSVLVLEQDFLDRFILVPYASGLLGLLVMTLGRKKYCTFFSVRGEALFEISSWGNSNRRFMSFVGGLQQYISVGQEGPNQSLEVTQLADARSAPQL